MQIDQLKHKAPHKKILHTDFMLKDAVVFYVDERVDDFGNKFYNPADYGKVFMFPSYPPYQNIYLQFSCGSGAWFGTYYNPSEIAEAGAVVGAMMGKGTKKELASVQDHGETLWACCFKYDLGSPAQSKHFKKEGFLKMSDKESATYGLNVSYLLLNFLKILSCKNIKAKKIVPKKRKIKNLKRKKAPLLSYYVLQIQQKTSAADTSADKDLWSNRVHLCRGHIKTYTKEKPLFGRVVGNIWCPPHARGNKQLGVVHKDYRILETV